MTLYRIDSSQPTASYDSYYQGDIFDSAVLAHRVNRKDAIKTAITMLTSSILCAAPISSSYIEEAGNGYMRHALSEIPYAFPSIVQESSVSSYTKEIDYDSIFGLEEPDIVFSPKFTSTSIMGLIVHAPPPLMTTDPEDEFWLD